MSEKEIKVKVTVDSGNAEKGFEKISKATQTMGNNINKTGKSSAASLNNLARASEKLGNALKGTADKGSRAFSKIRNEAQKTTKGISKLVTSFEGIAAAASLGAIGSITGGIAGMGVAAVKSAAQMRQYEIAFQTMLKSADEGTAMLQKLQKFAANTPFDVPGVVEAAQQLMAFGFQANEIIPMLRTLGDAASGLGRGSEGIRLMGYALGQIKASGTLKTQDVNQLTNAGINVWAELAKAVGKSVMEIKEMTEKGRIDSAKAIEVITASMDANFGGMMENANKEVLGLVNNIQESFGNAEAATGAYITKATGLKSVLQEVSEALNGVTDSLMNSYNAGKSFSEALKESGLAPYAVAAAGLATILGGVLVAGAAAATTAIAGLIGISAPVVAALGAIGAAAAGVAVYWDDLKKLYFFNPKRKNDAQGWYSSGSSDDWDKQSEGFDLYAGFDKPKSESTKGTIDLTPAVSKSGDMLRKEKEINRVSEALARAQEKTTDLKTDFEKLSDALSLASKDGAEKVFAQIENERNERLRAIQDVLDKQKTAIDEAVKMRASAESTGNAEAIAKAKELENERRAIYTESLAKEKELRDIANAVEERDRLSLETRIAAAKAEIETAMNASSMERFYALLAEQNVAKMAALQEEQALRQQLLDWRLEKEQSMLALGLEAAETLKNQLASGFADLVTEGGNFNKTLQNITKNIANMFIQYMAKKQMAALLDSMLGKKQAAQTSAENAAMAASAAPAAATRSVAEVGPAAAPAAMKAAIGLGVALALASIVSAHAKGGRASGWSLVGEEGPELVNFTHPGRVYTADETAQALSGVNPAMMSMGTYDAGASARPIEAASGSGSVVNTNNVTLSVSAVDAESFGSFLERGGLDTIRQALFDNGRNFGELAGTW